VNTEKNTTAGGEAGAAAPVTVLYRVKHELADMLRVAETLRAKGLIVLPAVTDWYMADAEVWESPSNDVAIKIRGYGDRPFRVNHPDDHDSIEEYLGELLTVLERAGQPAPAKVRVLLSTNSYYDDVVAEKMRLYGLEVAISDVEMPDPEVTITYRDDRIRVQIGEAELEHLPRGFFTADSLFARSLADLIHGQVQR